MNVRFAGFGKRKAEPAALNTTINFIGIEDKKASASGMLPIALALLLAAVLFSKFAVIDRYNRLWAKQAEALALAEELEGDQAALDKAKDLKERFYHFTWTQMSDEENNRMSRKRVADLVTYISSQLKGVRSYTISGNVLNVGVIADSLQSISRVAGELENRKIVESATVQTARTGIFEANESGEVEAQMVIYIRSRDQLTNKKQKQQETD